MLSPSITRIEDSDFVAVVDQPSFRNQVTEGWWKGERAYRKRYPEVEYWQTELDVVQACAERTYINTPRLYHCSRAGLQTIISAVPGENLSQMSAAQVSHLATVLRLFHREQSACHLTRLDLRSRIGCFQENICRADCLTRGERSIAEGACSLVEKELLPIANASDDLVHGDFNFGNVLYDATTNRFGFIDFERSFIGLGLMDVAKGAWRILHNHANAVDSFLHAYYGRMPTAQEQQLFLLAQIYEYLGAVSYFALEGHRNGYPYKDEALNQLAQCLSQF